MSFLDKILTASENKLQQGITKYFDELKQKVNIKDKIESKLGIIEPNPRFVIDENRKINLISDIVIDKLMKVSLNYTSEVPEHNIEDGTDIAEQLINKNATLNLTCKFENEDHKEKFKSLLELRDKCQPISIMFDGDTYSNIGITEITREIETVLYTDFTISLKQLRFVKLNKIPSPPASRVVNDKKISKAGKEKSDKIFNKKKNTTKTTTKKSTSKSSTKKNTSKKKGVKKCLVGAVGKLDKVR